MLRDLPVDSIVHGVQLFRRGGKFDVDRGDLVAEHGEPDVDHKVACR